MKVADVPVMFWGHTFPGDGEDAYAVSMNIRYNPKNANWNYTLQSSACGDTPYTKWINETFKPDYKNLEEGVQHITIVRELITDRGEAVFMKFGLQKKLKFPEELQKKVNEWKYWTDEPEPDTSDYYINIDLDHDKWQCKDAKIKQRGEYLTEEQENFIPRMMAIEGYA